MSTSILDEAIELHPLLTERWSPRAFHQTHEFSSEALASLLEAARWSPSANNRQPWRYIVATRGSADFEQIVTSLAPGNQVWARHASALIVALAADAAASPYAAYDLGQSVTHLSLQAHALGYHAHQMGGFNAELLRTEFKLAQNLTPLVVIALGEIGDPAQLPENLRERERQPRTRLPLNELVLRGLPEN